MKATYSPEASPHDSRILKTRYDRAYYFINFFRVQVKVTAPTSLRKDAAKKLRDNPQAQAARNLQKHTAGCGYVFFCVHVADGDSAVGW
jgi:hypothetical protein